jgi:hypothetical protein
MELNRKLSEIKMKENDNPTILFMQIAEIRHWYPNELKEDKVLSALLAALPEKYKGEVTKYAFTKTSGGTSTLKDLERLLQALWRSYDQTNAGGKVGTEC